MSSTTMTKTNGKTFGAAVGAEAPQIILKRPQRQVITVPLKGITPYIAHKWSEKSLQLMREAQSGAGRAKKAREAKNAVEEANGSTYWLVQEQVAGIPAVAFKAAMVGAIRAFEGLTMVQGKTLLFVKGEGPEQLVPILDTEWQMREDTPRLANGNADLRYRNSFYPWRVELEVEFPVDRISAESIIALLDEAGRGGVGEWRPSAPKSATGTFGQWEIDDSREVQLR